MRDGGLWGGGGMWRGGEESGNEDRDGERKGVEVRREMPVLVREAFHD